MLTKAFRDAKFRAGHEGQRKLRFRWVIDPPQWYTLFAVTGSFFLAAGSGGG